MSKERMGDRSFGLEKERGRVSQERTLFFFLVFFSPSHTDTQ